MVVKEKLRRIYKDPADPGSLGGIDGLLRCAKHLKVHGVNRQLVEQFLKGEQAYTLHRPARRRYVRNRTYVAGIDAQWQADLAYMQAIARQNKGARYLLTVIDVFSKYAWVAPVKSKDAAAVTEAFRYILNVAAPRHPNRLQTDKGKEYFNAIVDALIKRHNILHFASESDQKAAVVECFNQTIKTRIWTYLSDRGTVCWVDVIQKRLDAYNNSQHRLIGMAQADVAKRHKHTLWTCLYGDGDTHLKPAMPRNSLVRISKNKGVFDKGYMPNWSKEHFTVDEVQNPRRGNKRRVYKIADYNNDPVTGVWYPEELQQISQNQYRIERVLKRRKAADGSTELFVKWEVWPEKVNSWINKTDKYDVAT